MLAEKFTPASHAGEDQSSPGLAARSAHWDKVQAGLASMASARRNPTPRADHDAATLSNLVYANDLLAAGDMEFSAGGRTITFTDLISADDIVLIMSERAQKLFGPNADGYPGVDKMQKGIRDGALRGWIALCCPPDCLRADVNQDAAARAENGGAQ